MPDNVGYTPGTGAIVAADEIDGALYQRVKVTHGVDGVAHETSDSNPYPVKVMGELIEAIEAMRMAIQSLNRTVGLTQVSPLTGRAQVDAQVLNATLAVTRSGTWVIQDVTTVGNQASIGGQPANSQVTCFERQTADNLRRNISVT
jgi:hypothetical protein